MTVKHTNYFNGDIQTYDDVFTGEQLNNIAFEISALTYGYGSIDDVKSLHTMQVPTGMVSVGKGNDNWFKIVEDYCRKNIPELKDIDINKLNSDPENIDNAIASFEIKNKNGKTIELKPEIRIYNQPVIITSEADIRTTLLEDKFLVMNLVKGNEYFNIRYQVKPFMVWIWISVLLLCLGGLMSLFKRKI